MNIDFVAITSNVANAWLFPKRERLIAKRSRLETRVVVMQSPSSQGALSFNVEVEHLCANVNIHRHRTSDTSTAPFGGGFCQLAAAARQQQRTAGKVRGCRRTTAASNSLGHGCGQPAPGGPRLAPCWRPLCYREPSRPGGSTSITTFRRQDHRLRRRAGNPSVMPVVGATANGICCRGRRPRTGPRRARGQLLRCPYPSVQRSSISPRWVVRGNAVYPDGVIQNQLCTVFAHRS
jgi:hypothetical protein